MYTGNTYRFALALFMFEALDRLGRLGRHHAVERAAAALVLRGIESQENQREQWRWEASYTEYISKKTPENSNYDSCGQAVKLQPPSKESLLNRGSAVVVSNRGAGYR